MSDALNDTAEGQKDAAVSAPSRRDLVIGGMMAAAGAGAYFRAPHVRKASIGEGQLEKLVPTTIGPWRFLTASGIVLPPPDQLAKVLYDQQLARNYSADTEMPVMLVMAYGSAQGGAVQVHRPEICYPASGYRLSNKERSDLPLGNGQSIPVRTFTAESDTRVEQVMYWSRIADRMPTGWSEQRLAIMTENLEGYIPDGLLVRVSVISPHRDAALATMARFCRTMLAAAGPKSRHKLIGNSYT